MPVEDPVATAKEVSQRLNRNIRLVYRNKYEYDEKTNTVTSGDGEIKEIYRCKIDDSEDYLLMSASIYQHNQILQRAGIENLKKAKYGLYEGFLLSAINEPYDLYETEDDNWDKDSVNIRIFRETIELETFIPTRWNGWEQAFHNKNSSCEWLRYYRSEICKRAKRLGCQEVIICPDQGPTEAIFNYMNKPAHQLKEYVTSLQYYKDISWFSSREDLEDWKKNARHISFASYFSKQWSLKDEEFIEVIYDDFKDLDIS